ncbi:glycoside hydrolase family 3 N-terminal domain-containing protein [Gilvimarinus sp. SDUM040013]|uniref:Glycoside hydrolase family 3 N-terminal domain-containing protein n=1 Tax=Gilvimarinus gilvus TaxID=3058038 RepID=A0ABU4S2I8_9GAMM|nr:glycoside hydrolase family 3 N-terminal domain-containing protein [Gilvimarinus sp. SDUM040013]MDO3384596.1 glycoside hydrolase family 3 N-terminal domain-containing protein [Gilvimarinus sp. SDUM040013]MDX6850068.1 glycoside hydrolase family 3 N-terminal domain-containing protein [Gilvimarinus sp. SDUM040013]
MRHRSDRTHLDRNAAADIRIEKLLSQMSYKEKVAQVQSVLAGRQAFESEEGEFQSDLVGEHLKQGIGHVARPAENKATVTPNKSIAATINFVNATQQWLLDSTRLAIPAIFHEEALHGHAAQGATSFPQAIAMASTFSPELVERVHEAIAREVRARGGNQVLSPILDVARDPRWGRIEETFGEDPYLVSAMGLAALAGLQGQDPDCIAEDKVLATLKHLTGHGQPSGGLNTAPAEMGERALREIFLLPFEVAVKLGGASSIMASYNEIDGIPSHVNKTILNNIVREEWGYQGSIVSDYFAIDELVTKHQLCATKEAAADRALHAGVDIELPDGDAFAAYFAHPNQVNLAALDAAVSRILRNKLQLGLFEQPHIPKSLEPELIGCGKHVQLSQRVAEQAIVLLKNDKQLLPLDADSLTTLAVIGPHVHETLLGGYSDVPSHTISVLDGIQNYLRAKDVKVVSAPGVKLTENHWQAGYDSIAANTLSKERWHTDQVVCAESEENSQLIEQAKAVALESDVVVLVVGDNESTCREAWSESHLGDVSSLKLPGDQETLVQEIVAAGKPIVLVLNNGRPYALESVAEAMPAVLEAWYLGQNTGAALANVLFGVVSPSGKLPVSFPRSAGHIPAYYNYKPTAKRGYAFGDTNALFCFGHGLSYSTFEYSGLEVDESRVLSNGYLRLHFHLQNIGQRDAYETPQLYIRDQHASVTRPVQELKGFKKVFLASGAEVRLTFKVPVFHLAFYDLEMKRVAEAGKFTLSVGASSSDIRLSAEFELAQDVVNPPIKMTEYVVSTLEEST